MKIFLQVIVGTFDMNKNVAGGDKGDASASKLPSPLGEASGSSFGGFRSPVDSSGGSRSTMDPFGMGVTHSQPSEWRATQGRHIGLDRICLLQTINSVLFSKY